MQEIINVAPREASNFSDGFYRPTDCTKKRFLEGSLFGLLFRIKEEEALISDKLHIHLE